MVTIENLTKIYGTQKAVQDLSFSVGKGEILGFLGPNGAGKSTTMKILTGYIQPTEGRALINEIDVQKDPLAVRRMLGYLPEHNPLYLDMYVHEFLDFVGRMYRLDASRRKARIPEVIEMTGLGREQHKQIGALSKGYRQRVGLCQALLHDPEVLILDEPTSGLDPNQIVEIREMIREVGKNKTVIFSSHILSEVEAIAERVIIISRGQKVADSPTASLSQLAQQGSVIHVEFEAGGFDWASFEGMEGVDRLEHHDDTHTTLHVAGDTDPRKALFEAAVSQGHILLGMQQERFTLEDAFRELTGTVEAN